MTDEQKFSVTYERQGNDGHRVGLGLAALSDLKVDYTGIPQEQRGGTATRLLLASALYCFASTFASALKARGADILGLTGRASCEKGRDSAYRTKILSMRIELYVAIDDKDAAVLEKAKLLMEKGCLVTYSLEDAIEIEHEIRRVNPA
jgi:osmotically inducible protein OsmC